MVTDEGSFAYFVPDDRSFVVAKKKSDELQRHDISPQDWPKFEEAIRKEVPEVMKSMRVLSIQESQRILQEKPDRIIPSRYHFRWKPVDEGGIISKVPKARWILIGFKDPDILELERIAPTPQAATIALVANAFASLSMEAHQGDAKSAFAQSEPIDRERQPAPGRSARPSTWTTSSTSDRNLRNRPWTGLVA